MFNNSVGFYSYNFILKNKTQCIILLAIFISIAIKNFSKTSQRDIFHKICCSKDGYTVDIIDIYNFTLFSIIYLLISPSVELLGCKIEIKIMTDVFTFLYERFLRYRYSDWQQKANGEFYSLAFRRSKGVSGFFRNLFVEIIDNLFYIILSLPSLFSKIERLSHITTCILLMIAFPFVINLMTILRNVILRKTNEAYDISEKKIKDIFINYEMIQSYNTVELEIQKYEESLIEWKKWHIVYWVFNDIIDMIQNTMKIISECTVYFQFTKLYVVFEKKAPKVRTFMSTLRRVCSFTSHTKTLIECTENIRYNKLDNLVNETPSAKITKKSFDLNIEVAGVSKCYGNNLIFRDVDLNIGKSKKIAITGSNGSGKSSFVKVLVGIEKFNGDIKIDGINIENINEKDFRRLITYVPQDSYIFEGTVYENITCFDRKIPSTYVIEKISAFGMHDEMKKLGYNKLLAEKGRNISSAQRQKICFLRSVIRDTPIIVFDEITSEMDKHYESRLIESIISKMSDKTVIMIIHNLDLLDKFDEVIFFNDFTATRNTKYKELVDKNIDFSRYIKGDLQINKNLQE